MAPAAPVRRVPKWFWGSFAAIAAYGLISVVGANVATYLLGGVALLVAIFAAVHHAEVVAHKLGEPLGTLILTAAVTIIESGLLISVLVSGNGSQYLVRDTVFATLMIVVNGAVGLCILTGGMRHGELGFRVPGTSSFLLVLAVLAPIILVLPNYTEGAEVGRFNNVQLTFIALMTLALYGAFLWIQTVRHADYFRSATAGDEIHPAPAHHHGPEPTTSDAWRSFGLLCPAILGVVLLAKTLAGPADAAIRGAGYPAALTGTLVALVVLLPETLTAWGAARQGDLQKSLNLALGSSLGTIGLTIPVIAVATLLLGKPLDLGLDPEEVLLLAVTLGVGIVGLGSGRVSVLPGFVHLLLFATFIFLLIAS